jgi:hypothetical protein
MSNSQRGRILRSARVANERRMRRLQQWQLRPARNSEDGAGPGTQSRRDTAPQTDTPIRSSNR